MQAPSPQQIVWTSRAVGLTMLVLAVFSVYVVSTCYEPPVPPEKLRALEEGATKDEVLARLGEPSSIEDDGRKWLYSRFMKVRVAQVLFDDDDLLVGRGYTDDEESGNLATHREMPGDATLRHDDRVPSGEAEQGGVTEVIIE